MTQNNKSELDMLDKGLCCTALYCAGVTVKKGSFNSYQCNNFSGRHLLILLIMPTFFFFYMAELTCLRAPGQIYAFGPLLPASSHQLQSTLYTVDGSFIIFSTETQKPTSSPVLYGNLIIHHFI